MISKQEVTKIAKLARLELTEKEIEKMQEDLSEILDYFNSLKKVASRAAPVSDALLKREMRKDESFPETPERVKKIIEAFPDKKETYIKVKQIL